MGCGIKQIFSFFFKIIYILFILISFKSNGYAKEEERLNVIGEIITEIMRNSIQFKVISNESQASSELQAGDLYIFDTKGSLDLSYIDQESPQTSPFSTEEAKFLDYGFEISKLWKNGIEFGASYRVLDRENRFFNGVENSFIAPTLEFSVSSNIFQDLFEERYKYLTGSIKEEITSLKYQQRVDQKALLKKVIQELVDIHINQEELRIQKSLCKNVASQYNVIKRKRSQQVISKRDFLLGKKEVISCDIKVSQEETDVLEQIAFFESNYGFKANSYISSLNSFFKILKTQVLSFKNFNFAVDKTDEMILLEARKRALNNKNMELKAKSKVPLSLGLSVGSAGLNTSFFEANEDVSNNQFPYARINLKLDFPFVNRKIKSEIMSNAFSLKSINAQFDLTRKTIESEYKTVKETLITDLEIQDKFSKKVDLSEQIFQEGVRDFANGKIDFYQLVDYQKNLLEDQKALSDFRKEILEKTIKILDYSQYFNQFLEG